MRPGQNKRLRGRNNRKGPNPLTRSFESNGPDVKIRGTAQHIAEKYLQLARDAQSSGDTIAAENLLQHAEHYFRLIAAAQNAQQQASGTFNRQPFEAEAEVDEDEDFVPLPDRFAPLSERLPQPSLQQPFQGQPQAQQPHFQQPQAQPFEERPSFEGRHERPSRPERPAFGERGRDRGRDRNPESGERQHHQNFDRTRDNRRFQQRAEPAPIDEQGALPSFITAPVRGLNGDAEAAEATSLERAPGREHESASFHLNPRRRRRRPTDDDAPASDGDSQSGELPLAD